MAVSATVYGLFLQSLANKEIDFDSDVIKIMLCTSSYTPDVDTHRYKSSVDNEVSGTGYDAGGATIANCSLTYDAPTNTLKLDGDNVTWANSTITARYGVVYDDTPALASAKPLIALIDFGENIISSSGNFAVTFDAAGIVTMSFS